jgi:SepF-like predicted cell division protein (DUF552 family)
MKLENINKLLLEATRKLRKRLLFDFKFGKIVLKCLLLVDNRVLMVSSKNHSVGYSTAIDDDGDILTYLPPEFYQVVIGEIEIEYKTNSTNTMWKHFDNYLLNLDLEKISESDDNNIIDVIRTLKTVDKKYDKYGDRPYFMTWQRNRKRSFTDENNKKTARYFGHKIADLCNKQNISSKWSDVPEEDSLDFLDIIKAEKKIRNIAMHDFAK